MSAFPSPDDEYPESFSEWRGASGIFVLVNLQGAVAEQVREIQQRYDPRLAAFAPPHVTLIGSSGAGPIAAVTPREELQRAMERIARDTPPMRLKFGRPVRFMQTNITVLPLDPHGPLRALHEAIKQSGLAMGPPRHAFTPHVTLTLYRTLSRDAAREVLSLRVKEPLVVDHLAVSLTEQPYPPKTLFEVSLGGAAGATP